MAYLDIAAKRAADRAYYRAHRAKALQQAREWATRNPEKRRAIVARHDAAKRALERDARLNKQEREALSPIKFWHRVKKGPGCWEWIGPRNRRTGYGMQGPTYAHRRAWEYARGPIPDGLFVLHHCDNPPCVRPDHLFIGTQADNMRDMWAKGRRS